MKATKLFTEFFNSEKAGGLILIGCTILSLILANSPLSQIYNEFFHLKIAGISINHWINDGLMTVFFLLIGLELEREIYQGEFSKIKDTLMPIFGALGGMIVPASLFLMVNHGQPTQSGAGIPMATDIAFAIGILSLLGSRVPTSLKVFLTALAVIDDLGSIVIIAVFYSKSLMWTNLAIAFGVFFLLLLLNILKVRVLMLYIIGGIIMWYFMLHSGVHATITGIMLAFAIPFGNGKKESPSYILQHSLHKPVSFFILPAFALANTAIILSPEIGKNIIQNYTLGIMIGLVAGKPSGILLFSYLAVSFKLCKLPADIKWKSIVGVGFLAGIGFTMSIFITLMAFENEIIANNAKLAILFSSTIAGLTGSIILKNSLKEKIIEINETQNQLTEG